MTELTTRITKLLGNDIPTAQDVVKTIADGILSAVQNLEHVTRGKAAQVNPNDKRPS